MNASRYLTVRNLPDDVASALEQERVKRGRSRNQTVIELLRQGLGVGEARQNGIARLAGTWTEEEFREFENATAPLNAPDPDLWR